MENGIRASAPLSFLAGLGAGIAVAAFLTPRSGAATRRLVGRKVERAAEGGGAWVKNTVTAAQDCVQDCTEELRDRARDVAEVIGRS